MNRLFLDVQNWEDEDVTAALEALKEALAANIKLLSSWEKYKKEVLSGSLDWSPMHTSEQFWVENAAKFEERDFQVDNLLAFSADAIFLFVHLWLTEQRTVMPLLTEKRVAPLEHK